MNVQYETLLLPLHPQKIKKDIVPSSSLISHEGTVLYGYGENVPDDKQLKLEIFYTAAAKNELIKI
ncbi:hypothetical protein [Aquimarina hainanensis]|uniref:hypothetical protein n=1 Tax=Aquimarina hainanensis TaxID=1578017 RepID=UPI003621234B